MNNASTDLDDDEKVVLFIGRTGSGEVFLFLRKKISSTMKFIRKNESFQFVNEFK